MEDSSSSMDNLNCQFHNPPAPPGLFRVSPQLNLKKPFKNITGFTYQFLALIVESRVLNALTQSSDIELEDSDKDEPITKAVTRKDVEIKASNTEEEMIKDIQIKVSDKKEITELLTEKTDPYVIDLTNDDEISPECILPFLDRVSSKTSPIQKDGPNRKQKKCRKTRNIINSRVNLVYDYDSDGSASSRDSKKKKSNTIIERSNPYIHDEDGVICVDANDVKQDYECSVKRELSDQIRGLYYCKICKSSMNNEGAYQTHMKGKRHFKTLKTRNISKAIEDSIQAQPADMLMSRYRQPSPNVYRVRTGTIALSQNVIETQVKSPCPGLEYVIEIQGINVTHYYCGFCDVTCNIGSIIYHLRGFPHQLQCLRYFDAETYEHIAKFEKHLVKDQVFNTLTQIEFHRGRGKLTVEKDFLTPPDQLGHKVSCVADMPVPSYRYPSTDFAQSYACTIDPDSWRPDFYCRICDSHMNNKIMWEAHIRGKRHLKNCKKAPGEAPSKLKAICVPNARALIMEELNHVRKPVVGLDHIRETQKPEVAGAIYNCFLCGACCGAPADIVDHILSQKHRFNYLETIDHPDMVLLNDMTISETRMWSMVENICADVQADLGRGNIEVYITKKSVPIW